MAEAPASHRRRKARNGWRRCILRKFRSLAYCGMIENKIQQLPEMLVQEASDFIDFLLLKRNNAHWQLWTLFNEAWGIAESDLADYLPNLEAYENRLARGEIQG